MPEAPYSDPNDVRMMKPGNKNQNMKNPKVKACFPRHLIRASLGLLATAILVMPWSPVRAELPLRLDEPKRTIPAQDFQTVTVDSKPVKLSAYKGSVVFLNFWATWCPPCLQEMPAMERLAQQMKGKPFVILAVNQGESQEVVKAFLKRRGFTFTLVMDESGDIGASYIASALPTTYIIDRDGLVVGRAKGGREWDHPDMVQWLSELSGAGGKGATVDAAIPEKTAPETAGLKATGLMTTALKTATQKTTMPKPEVGTGPGLLPEVLRECDSPLVAGVTH